MLPGAVYTYIALYFSTIIFGNAVAFSAFLLAFLGSLGPWGMLLVTLTVTLADLSGDSLWFSLGKKLHGTKTGYFIKRHLPHHDLIYKHIHEGSIKWLYLTKFVSSVTAPFLFLLGWSQNVSFKKFFDINVKTTILWLLILITASSIVGSGIMPFASAEFFRKLEVAVSTFVIFVIVFQILIRYLSKKLFVKKAITKLTTLINGNGSQPS